MSEATGFKGIHTQIVAILISAAVFLAVAAHVKDRIGQKQAAVPMEFLARLLSIQNLSGESIDVNQFFESHGPQDALERLKKSFQSGWSHFLGRRTEIGQRFEFTILGSGAHPCTVVTFKVPVIKIPEIYALSRSDVGILSGQSGDLTAFRTFGCLGEEQEFAGFITHIQDAPRGNDILILPANKLSILEGARIDPPSAENLGLIDDATLAELKSMIPNALSDAFEFSGPYTSLTFAAVERQILDYVEKETDQQFRMGELSAAVQYFVDTKLDDAAFAGISAPAASVLLFAPYILLAMIWGAYRSLAFEILGSAKPPSHYWVLTDLRDNSGKLAAFLYSLSPYVASLCCLCYYAAAVQLNWTMFNFHFEFDLDGSIDVDKSVRPAFRYPSGIMEVLGALALVASSIMAMKLTYRMWDVMLLASSQSRVRTNRSSARSRP